MATLTERHIIKRLHYGRVIIEWTLNMFINGFIASLTVDIFIAVFTVDYIIGTCVTSQSVRCLDVGDIRVGWLA